MRFRPTSNTVLDLELQLNNGGWSAETQLDILDYFKGFPKTFENDEARRISEEAKQPKSSV